MSVCAKFKLSSWSRSGWKVCGSGGVVGCGTRDYKCLAPTLVALELFELSWVVLGFDNFIFPYEGFEVDTILERTLKALSVYVS